jgi:hypothetical protein
LSKEPLEEKIAEPLSLIAIERLRPDATAAMGFWRDLPERGSRPSKGPQVEFRPALVDSRLFPFDVFRRVSAKQLRGLEIKPASYKSPQGIKGTSPFAKPSSNTFR